MSVERELAGLTVAISELKENTKKCFEDGESRMLRLENSQVSMAVNVATIKTKIEHFESSQKRSSALGGGLVAGAILTAKAAWDYFVGQK